MIVKVLQHYILSLVSNDCLLMYTHLPVCVITENVKNPMKPKNIAVKTQMHSSKIINSIINFS